MSGHGKYDLLRQFFERLGKVAIAFSGGVDSTFLLAVAKEVLGEKVLALTVKTPYIPDWEVAEASAFCTTNHIDHRMIQMDILPEIMNNPENRCYLCKRRLFANLKEAARQSGYNHLLDGTNADDSGVYRPGLAALRELEIMSPLQEIGITKSEVRYYSSQMGLPTAEKPSHACLLTRIPYNTEIKYDELRRIEKAELYLSSMGFGASRVRSHGTMARIELEKERISEFVISEADGKLAAYFHKLGYEFITLDLEGYRSGSYDTSLNKPTS